MALYERKKQKSKLYVLSYEYLIKEVTYKMYMSLCIIIIIYWAYIALVNQYLNTKLLKYIFLSFTQNYPRGRLHERGQQAVQAGGVQQHHPVTGGHDQNAIHILLHRLFFTGLTMRAASPTRTTSSLSRWCTATPSYYLWHNQRYIERFPTQ